ncbi:MAG: hypothetical protein ACI4DS_07860 [Eubacterium sp.]
MKSIRICIQNIRKWQSNNRIKMVFAFAVLCTFMYTTGISDVSKTIGIKVSPWIFPFMFTHRYMKITFMIPVVFLFSDAPFIDANQMYVMIRSGRKRWCGGQLLYIIAASFNYALVLLLSSIIFNINNMYLDTEWGELLGSAGTAGLLNAYGHQYDTVSISGGIVKYYTPLQAMFFSFVLMWLSFIFLGMIMYLVNIISKSHTIGCIIGVMMITLTAVVEPYPYLAKFSPMSWNSLNNIDIAKRTELPSIDYILFVYISVIIICSVIAVIISRKQQMIIHDER